MTNGLQVSGYDTRRRGIYVHDAQYCGLTQCDLVGERDPLESGKGVSNHRNATGGGDLATHRYMTGRWRINEWVQYGVQGATYYT